ncbi:MAG: hypothetical protein E7611_02290 [Ruminococcaceae bacterium]|nr:hypothetical protein [Oscillospiraceae bacterium]
MKKRLISIILSLALSLSTAAMLASCNDEVEGGETDTEAGSIAETESESTAETESEGVTDKEPESESSPEDETPPEDALFGNGDEIKEAGAQLKDSTFSLNAFEIDESAAVDITPDELKALLVDKKALTGTEVFRVKEPLVLDSDTKYYGNFAAVIAEGGIIIKDASEIVIKELLVKGNVTVENSTGITFFKLGLLASGIGVDVDDRSSDIAIKTCRIVSDDIAFRCGASLVSCSQNYFSANKGIVTSGSDFAIITSHIVATGAGIVSSGKYFTARNCNVEVASHGVGFDLTDGSYNALVAHNVVKGVQDSIRVTNGFNCVVLLNSAVSITGVGNTNLYVVENKLGGLIKLENNNYLLCNGNSFVNDGQSHALVDKNNTNCNGNNIHDISARQEHGANEELLPHTNKDLFIGMERRDVVRDISLAKSYTITNYIRSLSMTESTIIIAPGVYNTSSNMVLGKAHSNTTLYAYGVYQEKTSLGGIIQFNQSQNYTVKGLTMGYTHQSSGQVYVLEKLGDEKVRVVTNAGYLNDFGRSNTAIFSGSWNNMFKADSLVPWIDISGNYEFISKEDDGTMIFRLTGNDAGKIYTTTDPGDVWCCRLAGDNRSSIAVYTAINTTMEDCVMYGYAAALAMSTAHLTDGLTLHRYHNTTHSGYEIDKETYDKYVQLGETYGVDLEVYVDEYGRYRGGASREGSVDATHISQSVRGADATSCIFEGMSDDGSNQRSSSSRLAGIVDNGDGTASVYIKGSIAEVYFTYYLNRGSASASTTMTPRKGDRIYAYGSQGDIIFDETTLTAATPASDISRIHALHSACSTNNGICTTCGTVTHVDNKPRDGACDNCGAHVHYDSNKNYLCDVSGCKTYEIPDENKDQICDVDNGVIITNRLAPPKFNNANGTLSFDVNYNGTIYTYNTTIYEFKISSANVNWDAVEKYNLSSNEYAMTDKILVDNLSANSGYFTFDNVLIQNARARGVVCKTVNATVKHCTFRNLAAAGVLMSVETTWGESTVAQDITVEGCLFENTGYYFNTQNDTKRASLSVQGLGGQSVASTEINETNLPCRNITIRGNKFNGTSNNYYLSVYSAQNVIIENNVFCEKEGESERKISKAILIMGCLNVKISGNTYSKFANGDVTKVIVANNYKGLTGSDVEGVFPVEKLTQ